MMPHIFTSFSRQKLKSLVRSSVIVLSCATLGYFLLHSTHAANFSVSNEAESGTFSGNAAITSDASASGRTALKFGISNGVPSTPANIKLFTGGDSIAVRWDGSATSGTTSIKQYNVYRNGSQIATVTPGFHPNFPEMNGNGYIDSNVTANQTYSYQVRAVDNNNQSSALGTAVSITQPAASATTAVPTVTIDTSAAPSLAGWGTNTVVPFIKTWYPKVVDQMGGKTFAAPSTIKVVVSSTATGDNFSVTPTVGTLTLAASAYQTVAQQQDLYALSYDMTGVALDLEHNIPSWVFSGLAYYPYLMMVRETSPLQLNQVNAYAHGSYSSTYFLNWIKETYSGTILHDIAVNAHNTTLSSSLFISASGGKTVDQLWSQMTGRKVGTTGRIASSQNNLCLKDLFNAANTSAPTAIVSTCNGYEGQAWSTVYDVNNVNFQLVAGGYDCLGVAGGGTADGSKVQEATCTNSVADQAWKVGSNGSLVNINSGKCLQATGNNYTSGTSVEIDTCNGSAAQSWNMPSAAAPPTPGGLRAFTGGNNIALVWDVTSSNPYVKHYNVYRNGVKIGISQPTDNTGYQIYGTTYTDQNVTNGTTYTYQIQSVDDNGLTSGLSPALSVTQATSGVAVPTVVLDPSIAQLNPEFLPWYNSVAVPAIKTWYPKFSNLLAYPEYTPPSTITIKSQTQADFDAALPGSSAYTVGASITMNPLYVRTLPNYESGIMIHETVHVMQANLNGHTNSRWFTEGEAEYVNSYILNNYPNQTNIPNSSDGTFAEWGNNVINANNFYATDWYIPAALMLNYINRNYDAGYVHRLNASSHNDTVVNSQMLFADGKNIDQVYGSASGFPVRVGPMINSAAGRCVDSDANTGMSFGTKMQLWDCANGSIVQQIGIHTNTDGTAFITDHGKCLTVNGGNTANQTPVVLNDCGNSTFSATALAQQKWTINSNGTVVSNVAANKCLEPFNAGTANGTGLQIYDCNGGGWQLWSTP